MKVVIRTDASFIIGTGHLMRCLTLAVALRREGADVSFVCREFQNNADLFNAQGFKFFCLHGSSGLNDLEVDAEQTASSPCFINKPDWLIVDHYAIGAEWERRLRPQVGRIMVIDDLANRFHDCDILLDHNLFDDMLRRYNGLAPSACRFFLGPRYALLRDEFIEARRTLRKRDGIVRRIFIFFGGSDPTNETHKALLAIRQLKRQDILVDVVIGASNPKGDEILNICASMPMVTAHRQVDNMAELISRADLGIGAGGTTTWERCFLGLPTLVVVVADNQLKPAETSYRAGLIHLVGNSVEVTVTILENDLRMALRHPDVLMEMTECCLSLIGQRNSSVDDEILNSLIEVKDAS